MSADITYELKIHFKKNSSIKEDVMNWLIGVGEESFVEGVVDGLDLDFDYENSEKDYYQDLGGGSSSLSVYKFEKEPLAELKKQLELIFKSGLELEICSSDTSVWQEGWKDSFKPFETSRFFVYPPWEKDNVNTSKMTLEVEPGMAFGTGQHATTQLCLSELESLFESKKVESVLDVGTGTGILAIASIKLGASSLVGTDIDSDSVVAAKENALRNNCEFEVMQASVPEDGKQYELVVANILFVVLRRIISQLSSKVQEDGHLLLSGVLAEEADEMVDLAKNEGLDLKNKKIQDGWVSLVFSK